MIAWGAGTRACAPGSMQKGNAMVNLSLDTTELRNRSKSLRATASLLDGVRVEAGVIAAFVGHEKLAAKVNEFGNNWDITRGRFCEHLEALAKTFDAIAETFEDLDRDLENALRRKK